MNKVKDFLGKNTALVGLIVLILIITVIDINFIQISNLSNVLRQVSINGLIALGMTFVILTGGIDLSVGSIFALTGAVLTKMLLSGVDPVIAIILTLILGALLGLVNGVLISYGKLQAFIATLGTMTLYRGITRVFMDGRPITGFKSDLVNEIGRGYFLGIPIPTIILIIAIIIVAFILKKTIFGKEVYAVGGNETAARFSAININRVKMKVYTISGFLTTIASIILASRLNSTQPNAGMGYELDAIAAVVLGGTSLAGGRGRVFGTVVGILIIGFLNNGLNILGVTSFYQDVVKGVVILLAVLIDRKK
ncbi:MAG: ribose ABC transporter permease [Bacilli bacterium]|nr:ribose ABC transporter permease [Bacilli bacterium]MDD4547383.1 ribose ABC transporter permease [Bacilli bacterium]